MAFCGVKTHLFQGKNYAQYCKYNSSVRGEKDKNFEKFPYFLNRQRIASPCIIVWPTGGKISFVHFKLKLHPLRQLSDISEKNKMSQVDFPLSRAQIESRSIRPLSWVMTRIKFSIIKYDIAAERKRAQQKNIKLNVALKNMT